MRLTLGAIILTIDCRSSEICKSFQVHRHSRIVCSIFCTLFKQNSKRHRMVGAILTFFLVTIKIGENSFLIPVFLSKENLLRPALKRRVVGKITFLLLSASKCMIFSFLRKCPLKALLCICT